MTGARGQAIKLRQRLIAIDLDGTLLDRSGRVPDRNRAALARAHEQGHKIVLSTGRSFTETRPILERLALDLDATVTVGGALLSDAVSGATLESAPLAPAIAVDALAWLNECGHAVLWLHDAFAAGFDGYAAGARLRRAPLDLWRGLSPCEIRDCDGPPPGDFPPLRLAIIDRTEKLRELAVEFAARFAGVMAHNLIDVPQYHVVVIEAFALGVDKWSGLLRLCQRWEIDPADTVALGDDVNDVRMLRSAGLGIAMGNAKPEALAAARMTAPSNDECGVAWAIEQLMDGSLGEIRTS